MTTKTNRRHNSTPRRHDEFCRLPSRGGRTIKAAYELSRQRRDRKADATLAASRPTLVQFLRGQKVTRPAGATELPLGDRFSAHPAVGKEHSRKQRWTEARPNVFGTRVVTENGRYSTRIRYTKCDYTHRIECWGVIVAGRLYFRVNTCAGLQTGILKAPRGWRWAKDVNGLHLTNGKGADYHPTAHDLITGATGRDFARIARENIARRKRQAREQRANAKLRDRLLPSLTVSLQDSRRAGNCASGSIAFASRLGVKYQSQNPYQQVPAKLLARTDSPLAQNAINAAIQRATLVSI